MISIDFTLFSLVSEVFSIGRRIQQTLCNPFEICKIFAQYGICAGLITRLFVSFLAKRILKIEYLYIFVYD